MSATQVWDYQFLKKCFRHHDFISVLLHKISVIHFVLSLFYLTVFFFYAVFCAFFFSNFVFLITQWNLKRRKANETKDEKNSPAISKLLSSKKLNRTGCPIQKTKQTKKKDVEDCYSKEDGDDGNDKQRGNYWVRMKMATKK